MAGYYLNPFYYNFLNTAVKTFNNHESTILDNFELSNDKVEKCYHHSSVFMKALKFPQISHSVSEENLKKSKLTFFSRKI